jgi:hypothetical protein
MEAGGWLVMHPHPGRPSTVSVRPKVKAVHGTASVGQRAGIQIEVVPGT